MRNSMDYGNPERAFFRKSQTFGLGQTNWAGNLGGIGTHFVLWVPCPCFPLINHYFHKKLSLYIQMPKNYLGVGVEFWPERIGNLVIVCS